MNTAEISPEIVVHMIEQGSFRVALKGKIAAFSDPDDARTVCQVASAFKAVACQLEKKAVRLHLNLASVRHSGGERRVEWTGQEGLEKRRSDVTPHIVELNEWAPVKQGLRKRFIESADTALALGDKGRYFAIEILNDLKKESLAGLEESSASSTKSGMCVSSNPPNFKAGVRIAAIALDLSKGVKEIELGNDFQIILNRRRLAIQIFRVSLRWIQSARRTLCGSHCREL